MSTLISHISTDHVAATDRLNTVIGRLRKLQAEQEPPKETITMSSKQDSSGHPHLNRPPTDSPSEKEILQVKLLRNFGCQEVMGSYQGCPC